MGFQMASIPAVDVELCSSADVQESHRWSLSRPGCSGSEAECSPCPYLLYAVKISDYSFPSAGFSLPCAILSTLASSLLEPALDPAQLRKGVSAKNAIQKQCKSTVLQHLSWSYSTP